MTLLEGWTQGVLADVIASIKAGYSASGETRRALPTELGVLTTSAVLGGVFDPEQNKAVSLQANAQLRAPVTAQSIIFCRKNSEEVVGGSAFVESGYPNLFLSDLLWSITAKSTADARWLSFVLQSQAVRTRIRTVATGTQSTMKNISRDRLLGIELLIPPLPEQRKISGILRVWDDAIVAYDRLLEMRKLELNALRRRVFGDGTLPHKRWELKSLGDVSTRVSRKSDGGEHPVMTISAKSGFVLQSDKYSRDMAGLSAANYTLLHQGEFAYNKGNSLTYPQGCIFSLNVPSATVPNVYFCFRLDSDANRKFYEHLFAAGALNRQLSRLINSGVRNNGLLNLNADDFFGCQVPVPTRAEQDAIAALFDAAMQEIGLLSKTLEQLHAQRHGLMQKLLTGQVRVTLHEEDIDV